MLLCLFLWHFLIHRSLLLLKFFIAHEIFLAYCWDWTWVPEGKQFYEVNALTIWDSRRQMFLLFHCSGELSPSNPTIRGRLSPERKFFSNWWDFICTRGNKNAQPQHLLNICSWMDAYEKWVTSHLLETWKQANFNYLIDWKGKMQAHTSYTLLCSSTNQPCNLWNHQLRHLT